MYVRADSSSGWENPDAGKHTNVPIPPVDGGFRTFGGRCAGVFLQWVEVFGLWKACGRTGYSSEWRNLDRERLGSGRIPPVSGGIWDVERCVGR